MTYENKPGFGALFRVENKRSDNAPDYQGNFADLDGRQMEIAGWLKTNKKGGKYLSLKVSFPREDRADTNRRIDHDLKRADLDDEIPF